MSVEGTITITNPNNLRVFSLVIPLSNNELNIIERSSPKYITASNVILLPELLGGTSTTIEYTVIGITPTNPMISNNSVMFSLIREDDIRFLSRLEEKLLKSNLENETNTPSARLVSVHIDNPTDFEYIIHKLDVIKTTTLNPNNAVQTWSFPASGESNIIEPHSVYVADIYDTDASEGEVYWMSTDIDVRSTIMVDLSDTQIDSVVDEEGFFIEAPETVERELDELVDRSQFNLIARKTISQSVVNPDDVITVTIVVDNLGAQSQRVTINDAFNEDFELVEVFSGGTANGNKITWEGMRAPARNSRFVSYTLKYKNADAVGIAYLDRARIDAGNRTTYTSRVPYVRRYEPKKVLYLQKRLNFLGADEVQVTLTLQNLGESAITDLLLKEFLDPDSEFREISVLPREKGLWEVELIGPGDSFVVTYITDEGGSLNTLPEIYGVERAAVTKSIMLVNTIEYNFFRENVKWIEILGIIVVILVPMGFYAIHRLTPGSSKAPQSNIQVAAPPEDGGSGELKIIKQVQPADPNKKQP